MDHETEPTGQSIFDFTPPHRDYTPNEALKLLMDGNARYIDANGSPPDLSAARAAGVEEHAPIAAILGCADARVPSEMIFDRGPGDLFMVRVIGNFLSDYSLASIEYCVRFASVPLVMVLGHTQCGAVTSAIRVVEEGTVLPGRLPFLIDAIEPAVHIAKASNPDDLLTAAVIENVRRQVNRLRKNSHIVMEAIASGEVRVVGGIYDLATGKVTLIDA